jgi:hypothetical protein
MKALLRFPYDLLKAFADGVHLGLEVCYPVETMPTLDELALAQQEAEEEVHEPRQHCGCFSEQRFEELLDDAFNHLGELAAQFSPTPVNPSTGVGECPGPSAVSADCGPGQPNAYPTDLYDAAQILELALKKGEIAPKQYFEPLIARLRTTANSMH